MGAVFFCKIPFYGQLSYYKNEQFHGDFVGFKLRYSNFLTDNWHLIRIRYEGLITKMILRTCCNLCFLYTLWNATKNYFAFYYFRIYIIIHLRYQFGKVDYAKTFLFSEYFFEGQSTNNLSTQFNCREL